MQWESLGEEPRELPVIVADGRNLSSSVPELMGGTKSRSFDHYSKFPIWVLAESLYHSCTS